MLARSPVSRLSMPTTVKPRSSSVSERCDPMQPDAPVMTTRGKLCSGSVGCEGANQGQPHDLDIESYRPVLDVIQIVLDALLERRVAAPAVDLGPSRNAGLDLVAQHVLRNAVLELLDEERPLRARTHDGHVALQHVPELRPFVEVVAAQERADPGCAVVVLVRPDRSRLALRVGRHRPELVDGELLAVESHALLRVE